MERGVTMKFSLKDKAVVLTGGSRGIGRAVAGMLAMEGSRMALGARDKSKLAETVKMVEEAGAAAKPIACDVTDDASANSFVETAASSLGGIDVFMNIAGITLEKSMENAEPEDYRRLMETNLLGAVRCTRAALPHLKKSPGVLVNLASIIVNAPFPYLGVYACSKWALAAFSHTLRQELHGSGVRVLTVYPTVVKTDMVDEEPVLAKTPSQTPEQAAKAIIKAIKKGKIEAGTSMTPKILGAAFAVYPPWADRLNRMFLPKGYK